MKKILEKVICFMLIFSFILGLFGCNKNEDKEKNSFVKYSQQEKQEYVYQYLLNHYDLKCDVSEVKKRAINAMSSEDEYFTIAKTENNDSIFIWITDEGVITDTTGLIKRKEDINSFFLERILPVIPDCKVKVIAEAQNKPKSVLDSTMDIEEYFQTEDVYSYIFVIANKDFTLSEVVKNELINVLNKYSVSLRIYSSNTENTDFDDLDLSVFETFIELKGE